MNTITRNSILRKIAGATALVAAMGLASQASAKLIDVAEEGGWTTAPSANDTISGAINDNALVTAPGGVMGNTVSWFTNSVPSSDLTIDFFGGQIDVPDNGSASFLVATVAQNNVVIFEEDSSPAETFPYIHTMNFAANFLISDPDAGDAVLFSDAPTGSVTHTETLNAGPCNQNGSLNLAGSLCDDLYSFNIDLTPPGGFEIGDVWYDFDFALAPRAGIVIDPLTGTIYTPEGQGNAIDIIVTITGTSKVPEPGMLALLGLGLAGIAFSRRRTTRR